MASYGYVSARERDVAEWRAEIEEIEAARAADAALAGLTPDAVRALLLQHAAEEPCQRRAPDAWRTWCAELDRLALALADAIRRDA